MSKTLKFLHDDDDNDDLAITTAQLFLWNRRAKNKKHSKIRCELVKQCLAFKATCIMDNGKVIKEEICIYY